jgi:hypothetical protein
MVALRADTFQCVKQQHAGYEWPLLSPWRRPKKIAGYKWHVLRFHHRPDIVDADSGIRPAGITV